MDSHIKLISFCIYSFRNTWLSVPASEVEANPYTRYMCTYCTLYSIFSRAHRSVFGGSMRPWYFKLFVQWQSNPLISQHFPGNATAGNVLLNNHSVTYQFQMTASTFLRTVENEGNLSTITPQSTIIVPEPGRYNIRTVHYIDSLCKQIIGRTVEYSGSYMLFM